MAETRKKVLERLEVVKSKLVNINDLESIITKQLSHLFTEEVYTWCAPSQTTEAIAQLIDHTLLKPDGIKNEIITLVNQAKEYNFGAVCVNGSRTPLVKQLLQNTNIKIAAVIGFPLGAATQKSKERECEEQVKEIGVDEIDMVVNIGDLKDENYHQIYNEISSLVSICSPHSILKVILECGALTKEQIIDGSIISIIAGADFIKTSTGFGNFGGAKIEDLTLMRMVAGPHKHVKASGGVRTSDYALEVIAAGADRIGTSSGCVIINELRAK